MYGAPRCLRLEHGVHSTVHACEAAQAIPRYTADRRVLQIRSSEECKLASCTLAGSMVLAVRQAAALEQAPWQCPSKCMCPQAE